MNRWSAYGRLDSRVLTDGDTKFIGVDMTRDRALLAPGMLARTENKRLRDGSAVTRPGNVAAPDFNPAFVNTFIGSGIYSNPYGDEVMFIAEAGATYVWALQYGKDPVKVNLQAGQDLSATNSVEFVQAFDKVLLLRNPPSGRPMLVWDGVTGHTFDPMPVPPSAHITPAATHGEPFQNRVLYYNARDPTVPANYQFIQSDVLVYNSYDNVLGVFYINAGESDWISRIWPYFQESAVVFKRRSVHQAMDFAVDPTLMTQRQLSKRIGLCGTKCVVEAGRDLLFLNEPGGIYRLNEVIQNQVATEPLAVSDQIMPIIRRINWREAEKWACAASRMEYAYFAWPLDGTVNGNNAVAVYNTATNQWESTPDTWLDPTFRIHAMHVTQYQGGRALFGLDYVNRKVYALYQGPTDEINNDIFPVNDLMETRGYVMGDPVGFKRYSRSVIGLRTLEPVIKVSAITDGVNEVKTCNPVPLTKDRLKFYPHGHADFDQVTGDPNEPKREDYSTGDDLDNFVGEDFEMLPVGPITFVPPTAPAGVGPRQESLEPFSIRRNARWVSMRVENLGLACDVLSVGVEATPSIMETKTAA